MRETFLKKGPELRRRILLAVVFLTPLFFLRNAYDVFNVPKLWLLMVAVAVVAAIRAVELLQGAERANLPLILIPAAAVAAALTVGTLASPYRVWSLVGDHSRFTGLIPYLVVILLGLLVAGTFQDDVRSLAQSFLAAGAVAAAYAILQVLGVDPFEWSTSDQATTTIGNTNFSGAFFAFCVPIGVGLFLVEDDRRLLVGAVTALVGLGWLVARSEVAWAAGLAGLLVFAGIVISRRWSPARLVGIAAAGAIAAAGVGLVVVAMTEDPPGLVPATIQRRAEWWQASLRMTADSPFFGNGPNSFAIEHTHHRDIDDVIAAGSGVTDDPHSLVLLFVIGAGVFGFLAFLIFAGSIVVAALKVRPEQMLGAAFAGAAAAYLIQSLLSVDVISLRFAGWSALGAVAAGLAPPLRTSSKSFSGKRKKRIPTQPTEPLKALPGVVAVILMAGAAIAWATGFLFADIAFNRALSPTSGGASAQENFRSAIAFRESNDTYRREYGRLLGANATGQALAEGGDQVMARAFLQEAEQALSFIDDLPHANSVLVYARVMRDWAQVDPSAETRALELYERAAELDPHNYRIVDEAAAAAAGFGREDLAQELSERAIRLQQSAED